MNRGRPTALLSLATAMMATCAVAQDVPDITSCITRLDPQVDIGYERIAGRCPELARQLEQTSWAAWLPRGWKESGNDLSVGSLKELSELARRELAATSPARAPDVQHLKRIAGQLADTNPARGSWWVRFKNWLRSVLESGAQPGDDGWLGRLITHVGFSQAMIELISYVALAVVVSLAGLIVLNELRSAGWLAARDRARNKPATGDALPAAGGWQDVERAAFGDQSRVLLELLARRLTAAGLLPPSRALTIRELTRAAALPEAADRARLSALALAAERVCYSDQDVPREGLEGPLAGGRELLERLCAGAPL
jgi:hypothetical protein